MAKSIGAFESVFDGFMTSDSFFSDQVKTITFTISTGGSVNPATGETTGSTPEEYSTDGFRRIVKEKEFSDIKAGDMAFTCKQADLGRKPQLGDKPVIDGVTYTVIEVNDLGQVAWGIQIRG